MQLLIALILISSTSAALHQGGVLYPRESEIREVLSLDGLWNFVVQNASSPFEGFQRRYFSQSLNYLDDKEIILMPVPASYNDITTDFRIRDHVGLVWYDRNFFVPKRWAQSGRVWIRFGSVSYAAQVWINGKLAMSHEIGHLPFQSDISDLLIYGGENLVTVACDNTLLPDTVPQGSVGELNSGRLKQSYTFDFFNYAGIDRSVKLFTTPETYIDDIAVKTNLVDDKGLIELNLTIAGKDQENIECQVKLLDQNNTLITELPYDCANSAELWIENPNLWWPYLMDPNPGYMYNLQIALLNSNSDLIDTYTQPIGIRSITWNNMSLLINNKPIYLHGFGRHEDSDIRGKGLDLPLIIRDYNLIKWIGANAYRTSHYPYAEEIMDLADKYGIMIIDECPAVNIELFSDNLLLKHKKSLTELIKRDKNRPSVIMWSAANEPRTQYEAAGPYFKAVVDHIKTLDVSRPVTIVEAQGVNSVYSSQYVDIISFNRYNGWYSTPGDLDTITYYVTNEAKAWHEKFNKPVIMQEYGADTLEGLHFAPSYIWSEEYQVALMSRHFEAFDLLRKEGFFIGEFIWNFADFKTDQTYTRVGGNKKGIFTRNREPKNSAFHLRKRYWSLANELNNVTKPGDLEDYISSSSATSSRLADEL